MRACRWTTSVLSASAWRRSSSRSSLSSLMSCALSLLSLSMCAIVAWSSALSICRDLTLSWKRERDSRMVSPMAVLFFKSRARLLICLSLACTMPSSSIFLFDASVRAPASLAMLLSRPLSVLEYCFRSSTLSFLSFSSSSRVCFTMLSRCDFVSSRRAISDCLLAANCFSRELSASSASLSCWSSISVCMPSSCSSSFSSSSCCTSSLSSANSSVI
mmetsp:Transcript_4249/g.14979  ORF Transcript_4249/g.14979 Transcript_4249/m.14979 type:complete len:217 (-) Transcript_4249:284-934(-)